MPFINHLASSEVLEQGHGIRKIGISKAKANWPLWPDRIYLLGKSKTNGMSGMKYSYKIIVFLFICSATGSSVYGDINVPYIVYHGMSDASAAVAVRNDLFVVADDENNVLRIYKTDHMSRPISSFDLTSFIVTDPNHPEADIEGATIVGDRIYWITSHGRSRTGQMRQNRYSFFATSVRVVNDSVTLSSVGIPCSTLVHEMIKSEITQHLQLDSVTRFDAKKLKKKERKKLAPKKRGLNIEGLCATPDGKTLYIGFRNPQFPDHAASNKRAIIVPLRNPQQVIEKGVLPIFGSPILWSLDGLGIRSMEYSHFHKSYFIIAGSHDETSDFALYRWSGKKEKQPILVKKFPAEKINFTPEALIVFKNSGRLLVLSDDGSIVIDISEASDCLEGEMLKDGRCLNKYLSDQNKKYFKGLWLDI